MEDYNKKLFEKVYPNRIKASNNYTNIKPIMTLIFEYLECIKEGDRNAFAYIKNIENDLFCRNIIPFKIENESSISKIDSLNESDIKRTLKYIWSAYKYHKEFN